MIKQFYEKALPKQGVYCVSGINQNTKKTNNRFAETLDDVFKEVEKLKSKGLNTYVALGSFDGFSRKADNCIYYRSLFIDLDVGADKAAEGKGYVSKETALAALDKFLEETGLPPPVRIDSGTGVHAYWLLEEEVPIAEYLPYAEKFKQFCISRLYADPSVMADAARIMRCPDTLNYKTDPPCLSSFLTTEFNQYDFASFKELLGEEIPVKDILATVSKGLDEETRKMLKMDNFAYTFNELADKSLKGTGCNQIRYMLENQATVARDQWAAGLTVAVHCADGAEAIHKMSNEYENYNCDETEKTAHSFNAPRTCDWFVNNFPSQCEGCSHRGRIKTPIVLGREFQAAVASDKEEPIWEKKSTKNIKELPGFLKPFVRGLNGGIYYAAPQKPDKDGEEQSSEPTLISAHDLFPIQRMYSPLDGECLTMRLLLPNDEPREFLLPMKSVYSKDRFQDIMASNGVICIPSVVPHLISYVIKWSQYMINTAKADIMRMQMGWTEDKQAFVIGDKEVRSDGTVVDAASSPYVKDIAKFLVSSGTYSDWKWATKQLDVAGFEQHAFTMLIGFGSPLMHMTSTPGGTVSLLGESGVAKTGALYAGLSIFGNPRELCVVSGTDNGVTQRFLGFHNIMFGMDEVGGKSPEVLSDLVHKVSQGKAKIRMQASVNAERAHEMPASLIAVLTSNHSVVNKFEAIKGSPDGEMARVIEMLIRPPTPLLGEGGSKLGQKIFETFRLNYGHAGTVYIKELYRLGELPIRVKLDKWHSRFLADFGDVVAYRFYRNMIAAIFAGGEIAIEAGIIELDIERVYGVMLLELIQIRDKVVKLNKTDYCAILGDFLNKFEGNTLKIKDRHVIKEPMGALIARISSDEGITQVSKTEFKAYLAKRNISSREFEVAMIEKKILISTRKGRLSTGWKLAQENQPSPMYHFKSVFSMDSEDDTESDT